MVRVAATFRRVATGLVVVGLALVLCSCSEGAKATGTTQTAPPGVTPPAAGGTGAKSTRASAVKPANGRIGSPTGKVVALTFDDGPDPHYTPSILAVLDSAGVKATFFEIGQMVEAHPQVASSVARDGMLIGDHTESHPDLAKMNDQQVTRQIEVCAGNILRFTGVRPHWFRFPYGAITPNVRSIAARLGFKVAEWDVDSNDWRKPPASSIAAFVTAHVHPGDVVLMHDGGGDRSRTVAALPVIIRMLKARGYRFVTLDELPRADKSHQP